MNSTRYSSQDGICKEHRFWISDLFPCLACLEIEMKQVPLIV